MLTEKQEQILLHITNYIETKGFPPSIREIGAGVGLKSSSTVFGHLERIEKKGYILRNRHIPRGIKVLEKAKGPLKQS